MSDQPGTESIEDDLGSYSVDDAVDAGSGQEQLLDSSEGDNEPWSPPDQQPRSTEWGTTAAEQGQDETIDQRVMQEVPDPSSAYGAPDNESGLDPEPRVGGDDPDSIDASEDFLGDAEVGDVGVGQLADPDEGGREDDEPELLGEELGSGDGDLSPEEQAMHVVDGD
ncbi:DUF5709 domain-containing protein [Pedococcus ginsenosidimutans]|uniref:DUF5709 domain-containing protein n=1 Tax=Pedococcus ginsenosidimutans TaxID=490570 RepID=A0ABP8XJG7_9MICO